MKKLRNILNVRNMWSVVNFAVIALVAVGAQQRCYWFFHQPEFPAQADKFRRFK